MLYGLRLRVMRLLGFSTDRLASETRRRAVRVADAERDERLGPQEGAIRAAQALTLELDAKALEIANS